MGLISFQYGFHMRMWGPYRLHLSMLTGNLRTCQTCNDRIFMLDRTSPIVHNMQWQSVLMIKTQHSLYP